MVKGFYSSYTQKRNDKSQAAIGSELAVKIYGLEIIKEDVQDAFHNANRYLMFLRQNDVPKWIEGNRYLTRLVFEVINIPAALYKASADLQPIGCKSKLDGYVGKHFNVGCFYADIEGYIEENSLQLAFFFCQVGHFARYLSGT